jgi:hypothetical protein
MSKLMYSDPEHDDGENAEFFQRIESEKDQEIKLYVPEDVYLDFKLKKVFRRIIKYRDNIKNVRIECDPGRTEPFIIDFENNSLQYGIGNPDDDGTNLMDPEYHYYIVKKLPKLILPETVKTLDIFIHNHDGKTNMLKEKTFMKFINTSETPLNLILRNVMYCDYPEFIKQLKVLINSKNRIREITIQKDLEEYLGSYLEFQYTNVDELLPVFKKFAISARELLLPEIPHKSYADFPGGAEVHNQRIEYWNKERRIEKLNSYNVSQLRKEMISMKPMRLDKSNIDSTSIFDNFYDIIVINKQ